jgi:hypothetical protein
MVVNYFCHLTFLSVPYLALLSEIGGDIKNHSTTTESQKDEDAHMRRLWVAGSLIGYYLLYTLVFE